MVATVRCEEIANEKYSSFAGNEVFSFHIINVTLQYLYFLLLKILLFIAKLGPLLSSIFPQDWQELEEAVQSAAVPGFGKKLSSILFTVLSE